MLAPLLAALTLLGLAYAVWKIWDPRFGLLSLWFWGGLLGAVLTMDTPSVQRLADAWPVILLFPAALLDRVAAGAWPARPALARRWLNVPLAALLIFAGVDGTQEYFGHYMSLCPYCTATVQARYAEGLGQDYKAYQFGVGGNDVYFTYGPTRFLAKDVAGADMAVPADYFPVTDNDGKGAAFLVYPDNADYLPLIRLFYPGGTQTVQRGSDGSAQFTSYTLTAAQMAQFQALTATYAPPDGPAITRLEPNLGTVPAAGAWAPPAGLTYPAAATWEGGLVAPRYALYTLALDGGADARLAVDGQVVLDAQAGAREIDLVLARGVHDVRLSGTLAEPGARPAVRWAAAGSPPVAVAAGYLYHGTTGGLSGAVWPGTTALTAPDFGAGVPIARRSDSFFGFREARSDTDSFGQGPFTARWQGTLAAPAPGATASRYAPTARACC